MLCSGCEVAGASYDSLQLKLINILHMYLTISYIFFFFKSWICPPDTMIKYSSIDNMKT